MRLKTPLEQQLLKLLPPGSLVWVVRNNQRHYQEMVVDIMVLPPGIMLVSTATLTLVPPKNSQRIRAYLSATGALPDGVSVTSLKQFPIVYRSFYRAPQPPKKGTTLTFRDVVYVTAP